MIKKYIGASAALVILMAPAGLVFADDGSPHAGFLNASVTSQVHFQNTTRGNKEEDNENDNDRDDDGFHAFASSTSSTTMPWLKGEKKGFFEHIGTTTPPGIERHHHEASSTQDNASSTNNFGGNGSITTFLQWIFGLPASTTVGDIRTTLTASTTASSTIPVPTPPGFFQKLLNFIQFEFH
jgi:hypothetical protein